MYRLHIDVPVGTDLEEAIRLAHVLINDLKCGMDSGDAGRMDNRPPEGWQAGYRLSNDDDRGAKNYLDINENGHASSKKTKITI